MGRLTTLIPPLLTLATLLSLIIIFLGNTSSPTSLAHHLYFLNISTTTFQYRSYLHTKDWYTFGLWNYCTGLENSTTPTYCSPREGFYHFDPLMAWGITGSGFEGAVPAAWKVGLEAYAKASWWMWMAYVCALATTCVALIIGAVTYCLGNRLSRFIATGAAAVSALFTITASSLATALFITLQTFVKEKLGGYSITDSIGKPMFAAMWIAVAFSIAAVVAWVVELCWCGGGERDGGRGIRLGRMASAYERVPSPSAGAGGVGGVGSGAAPQKDPWFTQDVPLEQSSRLAEEDAEGAGPSSNGGRYEDFRGVK